MSATVTTDHFNRRVTVAFDVADAKSLGDFLLEPGNDPSLGHRLLVACADLDGYGAIIDRRPRP